MENIDFYTIRDELLKASSTVLEAKGKDYTDGQDRLSNFRDVARLAKSTPFTVWKVYFAKHIFAILNHEPGARSSEPIESRFIDALNYLFLGYAILNDE